MHDQAARRSLAHPGHGVDITIANIRDTSTFTAFNRFGEDVTTSPIIFPGTSIPRLVYSHINMSTYDRKGFKPAVNNLGGLGPGIYMCQGVPTDPGLGCSGYAVYVPDPTKVFMKIRDVTTGPRGERVSMKIYNTSQYISAGKEVGFYSSDNKLRNNMIQINMRPFFNENDTLPRASVYPFGADPAMVATLRAFSGLGDLAVDARVTNLVSLFYMFTNEEANDSPVLLEE